MSKQAIFNPPIKVKTDQYPFDCEALAVDDEWWLILYPNQAPRWLPAFYIKQVAEVPEVAVT